MRASRHILSRMKPCAILAVATLLGAGAASVRAVAGDGGISPPATSTVTPPKSFWTGDYMTQQWLGFRDRWQTDGITFKPDWTGEVFGNVSGGASKGVVSDGVFELPLTLDLDPLTGGAVKDLTFKVNAFYIYGTNLSTAYVHDFSVSSNIAAYNTLRLDELWAQKGLWNNMVTVKVGEQAIDNEFFVSPSASLFVGSSFGTFTLLANNIPFAPVYPTASPGVRILVQPDPHYYVMAGVYGVDKTLAQNTNDKDGLRFALGSNCDALIATETGYLLNQGKNDTGLQGTYRLGALVDTGNFPIYESQVDSDRNGGRVQQGGADYIIYGVVDQQLYCDGPRNITIFARPGGAPSNSNFVDYYVDGGFNFTGFIPSREQDVAGLAAGRSHVSHDFSNAEVEEGERPFTAETYLEATYKVQLTPWWDIQPDFQYVITPSGQAGSHNATIIGVRTYVLF
ncbi:MAG TPA: carbohydrate porin [Candidatus Methylacidiphilales bacterium]|nr:carbohydrate porin [Candidatus Methylacidiphilales bacterium]